jgi:hypothetical protein
MYDIHYYAYSQDGREDIGDYTQEKVTRVIAETIEIWRDYKRVLETKGQDSAEERFFEDEKYCPLCRMFLMKNDVCGTDEAPCPVMATYGMSCIQREKQNGSLIENIPETLQLAEGLEGYTLGRDDHLNDEDEYDE